MTKGQAIDILQGAIKKPNTKDGYLGQAIDMAIKALEQQPCDDCVSRQAVLDILSHYAHNFGADTEIKALSQVTPTYGTCKDCKHCGAYLCGYTCYKGHWGKISKESNYGGMGDWYCADFEKRGDKE